MVRLYKHTLPKRSNKVAKSAKHKGIKNCLINNILMLMFYNNNNNNNNRFSKEY